MPHISLCQGYDIASPCDTMQAAMMAHHGSAVGTLSVTQDRGPAISYLCLLSVRHKPKSHASPKSPDALQTQGFTKLTFKKQIDQAREGISISPKQADECLHSADIVTPSF
jgi:hypothetical protein